MSLESMKNEIQKAVETEKSRLQADWDAKKLEISSNLEEQYLQAKERTLKLIEKEEKESYVEALLDFKMDEKRRLLEKRRAIRTAILDRVASSMRELLGEEIYYQFIYSKVKEFTSEGDTIYLSTHDDKAYAEKLVKDVGYSLNLKPLDSLKNGVIIEKHHFNHNFSVDALLEENWTEVENFLGKKLYEEIQESL